MLFFVYIFFLNQPFWLQKKNDTLYKCDGDHKYEPEEDVRVPNET